MDGMDQCCRELPEGVEIQSASGDAAQRCPREASAYHVLQQDGLRFVILLCEEHSHEQTAAINGYTPAEFTEFLKVGGISKSLQGKTS